MRRKFNQREFGLLLLPSLFLMVASFMLRGQSATPFGTYRSSEGFSIELLPDNICFVRESNWRPARKLTYKLTSHKTGFTAEIIGFHQPLRFNSFRDGGLFSAQRFIAAEGALPPPNLPGLDGWIIINHEMVKQPD
jgi:hypothetical protein